MFTVEQAKQLSAKLSPDHVKQREQAGRKFSYVEGWHAIAEANRIFGYDGWQRETLEMRCIGEHERATRSGKGWAVTYIARVRVTVFAGERTLIREGSGTGHGIDKDIGQAHESALKEAETDAMKRAFMTFGNPFGLALYDKQQAGVGDDEPEAEPEPPKQIQAKRPASRRDDVAPPSSEPSIEDRIVSDLIKHVDAFEDDESLTDYMKSGNFAATIDDLSEPAKEKVRSRVRVRKVKFREINGKTNGARPPLLKPDRLTEIVP